MLLISEYVQTQALLFPVWCYWQLEGLSLNLEHPLHECMQRAVLGTVRIFPLSLIAQFLSPPSPIPSHLSSLSSSEGENERCPLTVSSPPAYRVTPPLSIFIVITNLIKFRASTSRTRGCVKHFN